MVCLGFSWQLDVFYPPQKTTGQEHRDLLFQMGNMEKVPSTGPQSSRPSICPRRRVPRSIAFFVFFPQVPGKRSGIGIV